MYLSPVAGSVASALGPITTVALIFRASAPSRATHTTEPGLFSLTSMLAGVRVTRTATYYTYKEQHSNMDVSDNTREYGVVTCVCGKAANLIKCRVYVLIAS